MKLKAAYRAAAVEASKSVGACVLAGPVTVVGCTLVDVSASYTIGAAESFSALARVSSRLIDAGMLAAPVVHQALVDVHASGHLGHFVAHPADTGRVAVYHFAVVLAALVVGAVVANFICCASDVTSGTLST